MYTSFVYYWSKLLKKLRGAAIKNSSIHPTSKIESGSQVVDSSMGRYSFCGYDCQIDKCRIGSFTSIANNVVIGAAFHPLHWVSTSPVFYVGRDSVSKKFSSFERNPSLQTEVGSDVWIGQNVMIKQGVKVGHGAVIGMGSIVTKDVEPYAIVVGNPAHLIRYRFDDDLRNELIKSKWWLLDDQKLTELAPYIQDPKIFLTHLK